MVTEFPLAHPLLAVIFLLGSTLLSGVYNTLQRMGQLEAEELFTKRSRSSFFHIISRAISREKQWQNLLFSVNFTKGVFQLCYAITVFFFFVYQEPFNRALSAEALQIRWDPFWILIIIAISIVVYVVIDFLMNLFAVSKPKLYLSVFFPVVSPLILLCFPLSYLFVKTFKFFTPSAETKPLPPTFKLRDKILEFLRESRLTRYLEPSEQALILSIASFKERIAREIMVPRINVFSLSSDTSIEEAATHFIEQNYSRIPVYRDSVDHIIGVLLYKDVLNIYAKKSKEIHSPVESLAKPVLYTPETKKISSLLQEFKAKQIHLAIVVDEYGGTEGILTIEDILEELVGEIADEYDSGTETLFTALPTGGWIVDAKMGIFEIHEQLGITIPEGAEYETIGGYIYHRAGSIPTKGWRIHHDDFDLEVISSSERAIEKVKITPLSKK